VKLVIPLNASEETSKNIALLAVKCIQEIQDDEIRLHAAQKLDDGGNRDFSLCKSNIAPLDCRGLFQLLIHFQNLRKLNLAENQISDHGVLELCHLLRKNHLLRELDISSNLITDAGIIALCGVLTEGGSSLYYYLDVSGNIMTRGGPSLYDLDVSNNRITEEDIRVLCEALKHANCMLTYLDLGLYPYFATKSHKYICDALKHKNCKLIVLRAMNWAHVGNENCKLAALRVNWSHMVNVSLCEAPARENCKPAALRATWSYVEEISDLCAALAHENCKYWILDILVFLTPVGSS
jgi:hypothetical protein